MPWPQKKIIIVVGAGVVMAVIVAVAVVVLVMRKSTACKAGEYWDGGKCLTDVATAPRLTIVPTATSITILGTTTLSYKLYREDIVVAGDSVTLPARITALQPDTTYVLTATSSAGELFKAETVTTSATAQLWPPIRFTACGAASTLPSACTGRVGVELMWDAVPASVRLSWGVEHVVVDGRTKAYSSWFQPGTTQSVTLSVGETSNTRNFLVPTLAAVCGMFDMQVQADWGCIQKVSGGQLTFLTPAAVTDNVASASAKYAVVPCTLASCLPNSADVHLRWNATALDTVYLERDGSDGTVVLLAGEAGATTFRDVGVPLGGTFLYNLSLTGVQGSWVQQSVALTTPLTQMCTSIGRAAQNGRCFSSDTLPAPVISATYRLCAVLGECTAESDAALTTVVSNPLAANAVAPTVRLEFETQNDGDWLTATNLTIASTETFATTVFSARAGASYNMRVRVVSGASTTLWAYLPITIPTLSEKDNTCTGLAELFDTDTLTCKPVTPAATATYGPCKPVTPAVNCKGETDNQSTRTSLCEMKLGDRVVSSARFEERYPNQYTATLACQADTKPCFLSGENHLCCNSRGTLAGGTCTCYDDAVDDDCTPCRNCDYTATSKTCFTGFIGPTCEACASNYSLVAPHFESVPCGDDGCRKHTSVVSPPTCVACGGLGIPRLGETGVAGCDSCAPGYVLDVDRCVSTCVNDLFAFPQNDTVHVGYWSILDSRAEGLVGFSAGHRMVTSLFSEPNTTTNPNMQILRFSTPTKTVYKWYWVSTESTTKIAVLSTEHERIDGGVAFTLTVTFQIGTRIIGAKTRTVTLQAGCLGVKEVARQLLLPENQVMSTTVPGNNGKYLIKLEQDYLDTAVGDEVYLINTTNASTAYGTKGGTRTSSRPYFFLQWETPI